MSEIPPPYRWGYETSPRTLTKLMNSMRKNVQAKFRMRGSNGHWVTLRCFVVCIQEKNILNPRWRNACRLIFTLFIEDDNNPIRILYVTGHNGEEGHDGRGFDHIHFEHDAKNCGTVERQRGWPPMPDIDGNPMYRP